MSLFNGSQNVALFDYEALKFDEIDLTKGDRIKLIRPHNDNWYFVENVTRKRIGLVPNQYIAKIDSLDAERFFKTMTKFSDEITYKEILIFSFYFSNITRKEAVEQLQLPENYRAGQFLVRTPRRSEGDDPEYCLSFLKEDPKTQELVASNFRICENADGKFHISRKMSFDSIQELTQYYKKSK